MKVYILIEDSGYEGENVTTILGVFSTEEKAYDRFRSCVADALLNMDEDWKFEEECNNFWAFEKYRSSRNWINIWIAEEEVK